MMFIIHPIGPVSLMVNISINEVITLTTIADNGPRMKPQSVIIISFGSYFKKSTTGTLITAVIANASAQNIAVRVKVFVLFFIFSPFWANEKP